MEFKKNDSIDSSLYKYVSESIEDLKLIYNSVTISDTMSLKKYFNRDDNLIKYFRTKEAKQAGVIIENAPELTSLLVYEAVQYLRKAFLNYCAHYALFLRGYIGWSEITSYYASFFAINGLLRIQGKALIHVMPRKVLYLFPLELGENSYFLESARVKSSIKSEEYKWFSENHADIWREYYNHFQHFDYKRERYKNIYNVGEEDDITWEVERRNKANYDITYTFYELDDNKKTAEKIEDYKNKRILKWLQPLETDPEYFLYARSGSRFELLFELFNIITDNENLRDYFDNIKTGFLNFVTYNSFENDTVFNDDIKEMLSKTITL